MRKPTADEVLRGIEESDVDDAVNRALRASPEERRKELAAAGYSAEKLDREADALYARLREAKSPAKAPEAPPPERPRAGRTRWVQWAAVAAAAAVVVVLARNARRDDVGAARDTHAAEALRVEAFAACDKAQWQACEAKLDEAMRLDPDGEQEPRVQKARAALRDALGTERPPRGQP